MMKKYDVVIIGGGSAGMAAALSAKENGAASILILERGEEMGGILKQCIHNGFGLKVFKEEMTGPSFAQRLFDLIAEWKIEYRLNTNVLGINKDLCVSYVNDTDGYVHIKAKAIIVASGCYERSRGAISIPGKRLKGVYTAGTAQKYLNIENILVGKRVFILGSGDIGLIMARRMSLEGAEVLGVAEIMPYSNGLLRNIVQCLNDFDIPLYLSHTVTDIQGIEHLESITIAKVDENRQAIKGTEKHFAIDTLLLSIGLIPENDLLVNAGAAIDHKTKGAVVNERFETSIPHIYACGNALHVHDLVDYVVMEARMAGAYAAKDLKIKEEKEYINTIAGKDVSYIVPQKIDPSAKDEFVLSFRPKRPLRSSRIVIKQNDTIIKTVRKNYLLPSEMERINLDPSLLISSEDDLTITAEEL